MWWPLAFSAAQPIELLEDLAVGEANVVLAVAQVHLRFAIVGFFRGNPDTQFVAAGAHCLKLELNGLECDWEHLPLLLDMKVVHFEPAPGSPGAESREISWTKSITFITFLLYLLYLLYVVYVLAVIANADSHRVRGDRLMAVQAEISRLRGSIRRTRASIASGTS